MNYDRRTAVEDVGEIDKEFGEIQIAEYIVFLLALDTYMRYLEEHTQGHDTTTAVGLRLLRTADNLHGEAISAFMSTNLPSDTHKKMLEKALRLRPTADGASRRALQIRTLLSRGGATTMRAVFQTNKALNEVRTAIAASMIDDADKALDKFAIIPIKNIKLRDWIDNAAKTAGSGISTPPAAAAAQTGGVIDATNAMVKARMEVEAVDPASDAATSATARHESIMSKVQADATDGAAKALAASGTPDEPVTRSVAVGIATAAVAAALADPEDMANVPEPLRHLDPEQRGAALTDGKVLVAAGAGAGKSTTLVARIAYLTKDRGVRPSRILACSFNRKAANELRDKISKKCGEAEMKQMSVGTMHSLFMRFIVGDRGANIPAFGTPDEQKLFSEERLIADAEPGQKFKRGPKPINHTMAIRGTWNDCGSVALGSFYKVQPKLLEDIPKAKKVGTLINQWKGNDVSPAQALANAKSKSEIQAAIWYHIGAGLKGDIPGWRPPCGSSKSADKWMDTYRPGKERLGDLDDMIVVMRDILRRDPKARATAQGMFDHLLVDECVHEDSKVKIAPVTSHDALIERSIKDVQPGDQILSFENGTTRFKRVLDKKLSHRTTGYKIRTAQGYELDMTANHRLYATSPGIAPEGQSYLYLMYRKDLGFRIGVSDRPTTRGGHASRACSERADALWVLALGESSEILYMEQAYSLKYAIPTYVFEGAIRGCDQMRIDRIFAEFGQNGRKLLEDLGLDFEYPNWVNNISTNGRINRVTINLNAHRGGRDGGSNITFSWTGTLEGVGDKNVYTVKGGRQMFNRRLQSYVEAKRAAKELALTMGGRIKESISIENEDCFLVTASALHLGMKVPINTTNTSVGITLDEIVEITESSGVYYDLSIEDSANFFANDVLSHNCQDLNQIQWEVFDKMSEHVTDGSDGKSFWAVGDDKQAIYQFRGARPELFTSLDGKPGWKTRMIKTNYRCAPEIVDCANKLVAHNQNQIPMEARPSPKKARGEASIEVSVPDDNASAAIETLSRIEKELRANPSADPKDYAVLSRTNAELNDYETACIIEGIPYTRVGGTSFLEAPESKVVLGYLDLAGGTDFVRMQGSLVMALTKPDRGLFMGADKVAEIVKETLGDIARSEGEDVKNLNPYEVITKRTNARWLAEALKKPYKNKLMEKGDWLWRKAVDELTETILTMGTQVAKIKKTLTDPTIPVVDIFATILDDVSATTGYLNRSTGQDTRKTITLREQISNDLALFSDEEDEEEPEEEKPEFDGDGNATNTKVVENPAKGLGAVQFLYQIANPNEQDHETGNDPSTAAGFLKKLNRYTEGAKTLRVDLKKWASDQRSLPPEQREERPRCMVLSTVHSVKGAEWKNVFVSMPEGKFPIKRKPNPDDPPPDPIEEQKKLEAERNLGYVALTRASHNLTVVCPKAGKKGGPSQFVWEAGLKVGENVPKATPPAAAIPDPGVKTAEYNADLEEFMRFANEDVGSLNYDRRP